MRIIRFLRVFFTGVIEKIFRRKELVKYKTSAALLEKEVEEKEDLIKRLTTGNSVALDQPERRMILSAIEYVPFREAVELPETKAHIRNVWRRTREKIQLSIKKEDREPIEDDETKEA